MPIQTTCPQCGQTYNLKDELAGKTVKCKKCGQAFTVPGAGEPSAAPPAPEAPPPPPTEEAPPTEAAGIEFDCPECQEKISITADLQGQAVTCPYCNKTVEAPGGAAPEPPAAPPPTTEAPPPPSVEQPAPPSDAPEPPAPPAGEQPPPTDEQAAAPPPQQVPQAEETKGGVFKKVLITFVALLVIIGISVGGMFGYRYFRERNPATHLQRATEAMEASDFETAKKEFEKAIELKGDGPYIEAETGLAELFEKMNKPEEAIKAYKKLIELDRENVEHYGKLGKIYEKQGKREEAIKTYEGIIAIKKDDPAGYRALAGVCIQWADECKSLKEATFFIDKAIEACEGVVKLEPKDDDTIAAIGLLLMRKGHTSKAEDRLKEAVKINDKNAKAHYGLGKIYKDRQQSQRAFSELQKALTLDRSLTDARLDIAEMYVILMKTDDNAVSWCKNVVSTMPKSSKAHEYLARVYLNKGKVNEAATAFQKAIDLDPNNGAAKIGLTQAQQQGGKVK